MGVILSDFVIEGHTCHFTWVICWGTDTTNIDQTHIMFFPFLFSCFIEYSFRGDPGSYKSSKSVNALGAFRYVYVAFSLKIKFSVVSVPLLFFLLAQ